MKQSAAAFAVIALIVASVAIASPKSEREARRVIAAAPTTTTTTAPSAPACLSLPPILLDPGLLASGEVIGALQQALGVTADQVFGPLTAAAYSGACGTDVLVGAGQAVVDQSDALTAQAQAARVAHVSPQVAAQVQSQCGSDFACFKACTLNIESHGDYGAISPGGTYRGAWQFDQRTWDSNAAASGHPELVGVDPASASPASQDAVAQATYDSRGNQPWGGRC